MITALSLLIAAQSGTYVVEDPKGVNAVRWFIDSPLEPIAGTASGVKGSLQFDPANPNATKGTVTIPVAGMRAPVDAMSDHLKGEKWLDAAKYPEITFAIASVSSDKGTKGLYKGTVTGDLTMHGVTKRLTTRFHALHTPGGLKDRSGGRMAGDLLKFSTDFVVKRSDYGVGPQMPEILKEVGDEIEIRLALATMRPEAN